MVSLLFGEQGWRGGCLACFSGCFSLFISRVCFSKFISLIKLKNMDGFDIFIVIVSLIVCFLTGWGTGVTSTEPHWPSLQEQFVDCLEHDNDPVWCFEGIQ